MAVINLLEEKSLNRYLQDLVYDGGAPTIIKVGSVETARDNIDAVARNIVFQYLKRNMREYAKWKTNLPCFVKIDKNRSDLPEWTKTTFARGEDIYEFDVTNVPEDFRYKLLMVCNYLCGIATSYIEEQCEKVDASNGAEKLVIEYDYFKKNDAYKDFNKVYKFAEWNALVENRRNRYIDAFSRYIAGKEHYKMLVETDENIKDKEQAIQEMMSSDLNLLSTIDAVDANLKQKLEQYLKDQDLKVVLENVPRGQKAVGFSEDGKPLTTESFKNQAELVLLRDAEARVKHNANINYDVLKVSPEIQAVNEKFLQDADKVTSNTEFNNLLRNRHVAIEQTILKQIGGQKAILEFAELRKKQYLDVFADMLKDEQYGAMYADMIKNWKNKSYIKQQKFFDEFIKRAYPSVENPPKLILGSNINSSDNMDKVINISNKTKNIRINIMGKRKTLHQHINFNDTLLAVFHELEHNLIAHNPELTIFKGKENLVADVLFHEPSYNINKLPYGGFVTWDTQDGQKILAVNEKTEINKLFKDFVSINNEQEFDYSTNSDQEFDYRFLNANENMAHRVGEIAGYKFLENLNKKLLSEYKDTDNMPEGVKRFVQAMKTKTMKISTKLLKIKNVKTNDIDTDILHKLQKQNG